MRADARVRRTLAAGAAAAALTCGPYGVAEAQLSALMRVQFQRVEQDAPLPDGSVRTSVESEFWLQTYELNHAVRLTRATLVTSQLRLTEVSYVGRPDASRTPFGSVRLTNPRFGFSGGYRPTSTTVSIEDDVAGDREMTSRLQESYLTGYASLPTGTRLNATWTRRHRDPDASTPENTGVNRSLRGSQTVGPVRLRGGYSDLLNDRSGTDPSASRRSWDGGAAVSGAPWAGARLDFDYGFTRVERLALGEFLDRTTAHTASLGGVYRQSQHLDWAARYTFRIAEPSVARDAQERLHDGSAQVQYRPNRLLGVTGAGGVRTVRSRRHDDLLRFLSAGTSLGGELLPGLHTQMNVSETVNWEDGGERFSNETASGNFTWRLRSTIEVRGDATASALGDTALGNARVSSQTGIGFHLQPFQSVLLSYSTRNARTGPGLLDAVSNARSHVFGLRWTPLEAIELTGGHTVSGTAPDNEPRLSTTTWTLRTKPVQGMEAWGTLSRSNYTSGGGPLAEALTGSEILTARLVWSLSRDVTLIGGTSIANRGLSTEGRQYDVSITKQFGR